MSEDVNRIHRQVVEALGDPLATEGARGGWLAEAGWGEAVERARLEHFAHLGRAEGWRRVGQRLGEQYSAGAEGALLRESIRGMSVDAVFSRVLPVLGTRWRQPLQVEWIPSGSGGILRAVRRRLAPGETTLGFLEAIASALQPPPRLTLRHDGPELLEIEVERHSEEDPRPE